MQFPAAIADQFCAMPPDFSCPILLPGDSPAPSAAAFKNVLSVLVAERDTAGATVPDADTESLPPALQQPLQDKRSGLPHMQAGPFRRPALSAPGTNRAKMPENITAAPFYIPVFDPPVIRTSTQSAPDSEDESRPVSAGTTPSNTDNTPATMLPPLVMSIELHGDAAPEKRGPAASPNRPAPPAAEPPVAALPEPQPTHSAIEHQQPQQNQNPEPHPVQHETAQSSPVVTPFASITHSPASPDPQLAPAQSKPVLHPAARPATLESPWRAEAPVEPAKPQQQPMRSLALEFTPDGAHDVRLRLSERGGDVHISLHSSDHVFSGRVREGVGELLNSLSRAGYDASAWTQGKSPEQSDQHQRRQNSTGWESTSRRRAGASRNFESILDHSGQEIL